LRRYRKSKKGSLTLRASKMRRRVRTGPALSAASLSRVHARYGGVCVYCGAPGKHVDHFLPIALGGTNTEENLVVACATCNCSKGAKEPFAWMAARGIRFIPSRVDNETVSE
jgi:5-methylcytosine-specific restriction endonuclease McrA